MSNYMTYHMQSPAYFDIVLESITDKNNSFTLLSYNLVITDRDFELRNFIDDLSAEIASQLAKLNKGDGYTFSCVSRYNSFSFAELYFLDTLMLEVSHQLYRKDIKFNLIPKEILWERYHQEKNKHYDPA